MNLKVIVVGDYGVGKTHYVKKLKSAIQQHVMLPKWLLMYQYIVKLDSLKCTDIFKYLLKYYEVSTDTFDGKYIPTHNREITDITVKTNYGTIHYNIWDCAGKELFSGTGDLNYNQAQAVIFMFDINNKTSLTNLSTWTNKVGRVVTNNPPILILGNKCDILNHKIKLNDVSDIVGTCITDYFTISVCDGTNLVSSWLNLTKKLTGHLDLGILSIL